jgi:hypothetical protein
VAEPIQIVNEVVELKTLKGLENNPHYMTASQFGRLMENIERDGVLTSSPLVYKNEILSGNHRVQAAIKAGITHSNAIIITSELTPSQKTAIALSHNAINGQDDLSILQSLYDTLDIEHKAYSGLTDDSFNIDGIDINGLSIGAIKYQEITLYFLPEEHEVFMHVLKLIEAKAKRASPPVSLMARLEDFDEMFEAITKSKKAVNIHNSALVVKTIADMTLAKLTADEAEAERLKAEQNDSKK